MCIRDRSLVDELLQSLRLLLFRDGAYDGSVSYTHLMDFKGTPHMLRHTYITNLIYKGVDPKTVPFNAARMQHSQRCLISQVYYT